MQRWLTLLAHNKWGWLPLLICLGTLAVASFGLAGSAGAEGSRDLYPAGSSGNRANIEWRNSFYGSFLRRRSLFQVYAAAGKLFY